jgi:hypothetical protein
MTVMLIIKEQENVFEIDIGPWPLSFFSPEIEFESRLAILEDEDDEDEDDFSLILGNF